MGYILYILFFSFCAFFLAMAMPEKKKGSILLCALIGLYFIPIASWLNFFISIDYSQKPIYPDGFMDAVLFNRENESRMLPVNSDYLISDVDYRKEKNGKTRILILGDSFAAGHGLKYEETMGQQIQKTLGNGYEVINAAFFGSNARLQVDYYLSHCAPYKPDVIILWSRADDALPVDEKWYLERTLQIINNGAPHWPTSLKNSIFKILVLFNREKFWRYYSRNTESVVSENLANPLQQLNLGASQEDIDVIVIGDRCKPKVTATCSALKDRVQSFEWQYVDPYDFINLDDPENKIPGDGHPTAPAISIISKKVSEVISALSN